MEINKYTNAQASPKQKDFLRAWSTNEKQIESTIPQHEF
jgi:hypothetical protein